MPTHTFTVNGKRVSVDCADNVRVLWVLRDLLGVHGPKYGCGLDVCRACTSFINGESFNPCSVEVGQLKSSDHITTIEGLPATVHADLHPMQQAWIDYDVGQCGFCQPGQIMNAVALLDEIHGEGRQITEADLDKIRNICRCGTYARIREAIESVTPTPGCPLASGRIHGTTLGLVHLGMTRAQARHAYQFSSNRKKNYEDFFCLTPTGVRVSYGSPKLLKTLPERQRARYDDRVVFISTSNRIFNVSGVRPAESVARARRHLKLTGPFDIGLNDWYLAPHGDATAVLKTRHGEVEEVGICDKALTHTHSEQVALLKSFY